MHLTCRGSASHAPGEHGGRAGARESLPPSFLVTHVRPYLASTALHVPCNRRRDDQERTFLALRDKPTSTADLPLAQRCSKERRWSNEGNEELHTKFSGVEWEASGGPSCPALALTGGPRRKPSTLQVHTTLPGTPLPQREGASLRLPPPPTTVQPLRSPWASTCSFPPRPLCFHSHPGSSFPL